MGESQILYTMLQDVISDYKKTKNKKLLPIISEIEKEINELTTQEFFDKNIKKILKNNKDYNAQDLLNLEKKYDIENFAEFCSNPLPDHYHDILFNPSSEVFDKLFYKYYSKCKYEIKRQRKDVQTGFNVNTEIEINNNIGNIISLPQNEDNNNNNPISKN